MSFVKAYTQRFDAAKLAVPVDLTPGDWVSPVATVVEAIPNPTTSLYVGTSGDLVVGFAGDPSVPVTLKNHPDGYADIGVVKVYKAGTTALNIVALY